MEILITHPSLIKKEKERTKTKNKKQIFLPSLITVATCTHTNVKEIYAKVTIFKRKSILLTCFQTYCPI